MEKVNNNEPLNFEFKLKDKCFLCGGDLYCNYQETDFIRFVKLQSRFLTDVASKYDGCFKVRGKVFKKNGKWHCICPKCQSKK